MNTFRFLYVLFPALEKMWLQDTSSTHSEQLTFISILSTKELLSKHRFIYKPVRFGLLRWRESCPITRSRCCWGTHTRVRSRRRVRAAAVAIVSEALGRKVGERERQKESVSKQAWNSKSSCLGGGGDPMIPYPRTSQTSTFWKYCSNPSFKICNLSSHFNINHVMDILDSNSELLVWKIMRD